MNYLDIIMTHFSAENAKHISLVAVILYSVICRLNLLDESSKTTIPIITLSHIFIIFTLQKHQISRNRKYL